MQFNRLLAVKKLLLLFFLLLILAFFYFGLACMNVDGEAEKKINQELSAFSYSTVEIQQVLEKVSQDLNSISTSPDLIGYISQHESDNPANLLSLFRDYVEQREYQQLRLIDENGDEQIRVELQQGQAIVVGQSLLQNISDRYYFREAIQLDQGQFYYSPIDYKVEFHRADAPLRPVTRVATPVVNNRNEISGIVVINMDSRSLAHQLEEQALIE